MYYIYEDKQGPQYVSSNYICFHCFNLLIVQKQLVEEREKLKQLQQQESLAVQTEPLQTSSIATDPDIDVFSQGTQGDIVKPKYTSKASVYNSCILTLYVPVTPKCVLRQSVKTQMKCHIMWHFIRTYTVCKEKNNI